MVLVGQHERYFLHFEKSFSSNNSQNLTLRNLAYLGSCSNTVTPKSGQLNYSKMRANRWLDPHHAEN